MGITSSGSSVDVLSPTMDTEEAVSTIVARVSKQFSTETGFATFDSRSVPCKTTKASEQNHTTEVIRCNNIRV